MWAIYGSFPGNSLPVKIYQAAHARRALCSSSVRTAYQRGSTSWSRHETSMSKQITATAYSSS
jgi:hypothetical protein